MSNTRDVTNPIATYNHHERGLVNFPRFSRAAADLVQGEWDLTQFADMRERALMLKSLETMLNATYKLGEDEHTSDWDWFVGITLHDGTRLGDDSYAAYNYDDLLDNDTATYCDTFSLPDYPQLANDTAEETYGNIELTLDLWPAPAISRSPDDVKVVRVADIASITISER